MGMPSKTGCVKSASAPPGACPEPWMNMPRQTGRDEPHLPDQILSWYRRPCLFFHPIPPVQFFSKRSYIISKWKNEQ